MMLTAIWDSPTKIHPYSLSHYSLTHSRSSAKGISYILPGKGGGQNQDTDSHRNFKVWNRFGLGSQNFGTRPHQTSTQPKKTSFTRRAINRRPQKEKTLSNSPKPRVPTAAYVTDGEPTQISGVTEQFVMCAQISYGGLLQIDIRNNNSDAPPAK